MNIEHIETDQNWTNETTIYWFNVDGDQWAISDCNGDYSLLDCDGCPVVIEQYKIAIYEALTHRIEGMSIWDALSDVPVDGDGTDGSIDQDFLHFSKGTEVYGVWHWLEQKYNLSVFEDLM